MPFYIEQLLLPFVGGTKRRFGALVEEPSLFVSVAHTAHSQINSGIQRVTRSIAGNVLKQKETADLLEWFVAQERYILLDEVARKKFSKFSGPEYVSIADLVQAEVDEMLKSISEGEIGERALNRLLAHVLSDDFIQVFKKETNWADRLNFRIIRKRFRQNLSKVERLKVIASGSEKSNQSEVDGLLADLVEYVEALSEYLEGTEFSNTGDPFRERILDGIKEEEGIGQFGRVISQRDHGPYRPLAWIAFLPISQPGRSFIRRRIRKIENWKKRSLDRKLTKGFIVRYVRLRKAADFKRAALRKISEIRQDLATDLCLVLQMSRNAEAFESVEKIEVHLKRISLVKRRLDPRNFLPAKGSWILIPELMTSEEFEGVFKFARDHDLKTAVVFHDALPVQFPELVSERYRNDHENYMRSIAQADCLLPVSLYSKKCYEEWANAQQIVVPRMEPCLNGVNFGAKPKGLNSIELPPEVQGEFALCVSTVEPRKNHLKLIEAWNELAAARASFPQLVLVGNEYKGFEELSEKVAAMCERNPNALWLKGVDDALLETLYSRATFTVFPSIAEGFGLPILESVWYGKPCLCANFGAMAEAAEGGGCLTVDVKSVEALKEGIARMMTDSVLRERLKAECEVRELRTWGDYAAEVISLLKIPEGAE